MELTEFEENLLQIVKKYRTDNFYHSTDFMTDFRKIMPPICTETERKFLDGVKVNFILDEDGDLEIRNTRSILGKKNYIFQHDFLETNLKDLIEGK